MKMITFREEEKSIHSGQPFLKLLRVLARPELGFIKSIIVTTLAMSILGLALPIAVQSIINNVGSRTMMQPIFILSFILLFVLSFSGLLQIIQTYTIEILRRRLFIRFGIAIMERLSRYKNDDYTKVNISALTDRYYDIIIMQTSMVTFFVEGSSFIIMYIIGFTLLILYHPYFLLFAILVTLLLIADWLLFGPKGIAAGSPEADGKYNVVSWINEIGRTRNIFMSKGGRIFADKKIVQRFNEWITARENLFSQQFRQHIGLQFFSVISNVILIFLGSMLVLKGELSIGQLVASALVLGNIVSNIGKLQAFFISIYDYSTSLDKIAEFYNFPLEEDNSEKAPESFNVKFDNVTVHPNFIFNFEFDERSKNYIYIKSFSAKNKLLELIQGLTLAEKGHLFIGNKIITDLDISVVRDHISIIKSDHYFNGTILENLTGFILDRKPDKTEITDALSRVGLLEIIESLPNGLDTIILPHGNPLSKSQLLTLQVARVILSRPRIVIVTSDFEYISTFKRNLCFSELTNKASPWTLLFFSQRLQKDYFEKYYGITRAKLINYSSRQDMAQEIGNEN